MATYRPMAVGARLLLELSLPDGPLRVTGTVRWVREHGTWRFARKELQHDIAGDMALKNKR